MSERQIEIPENLKIGAHNVKVIFPHEFRERVDLQGQYDKPLAEIRIAKLDSCGNSRALSEIWVTLFHEIIHAIDHSTGHGMFLGADGEKWIEGLSEGLYQVFNDNGLLKLHQGAEDCPYCAVTSKDGAELQGDS